MKPFADPFFKTVSNIVVKRLNHSFSKHSLEAIGCLLALEITSIYGTHTCISAFGLAPIFTSEFAFAFALARPLRRVRFPLDVTGAAVLRRLAPSLGEVKLLPLLNALPNNFRTMFNEKVLKKQGPRAKAAKEKLVSALDNYGAAYLLSQRWTGSAVVFAIYGMLHLGVDVSSYIHSLGLASFETSANVLGTWAGAVIISSVFYPATVMGGGFLAPKVAKFVRSARI